MHSREPGAVLSPGRGGRARTPDDGLRIFAWITKRKQHAPEFQAKGALWALKGKRPLPSWRSASNVSRGRLRVRASTARSEGETEQKLGLIRPDRHMPLDGWKSRRLTRVHRQTRRLAFSGRKGFCRVASVHIRVKIRAE